MPVSECPWLLRQELCQHLIEVHAWVERGVSSAVLCAQVVATHTPSRCRTLATPREHKRGCARHMMSSNRSFAPLDTTVADVHKPPVARGWPAGKFRAQRFDGVDDQEDRPLITQFCGNDPNTVVRAARHIEHKCDAIDLNLGCPQNIAKRGNYGAFLLPNPQLCVDIVSAMSR